MAGRYQVVGPGEVHGVTPDGEDGILEENLSPEEEYELLARGEIKILPREYRVVGTSNVSETEPGGTFHEAYTAGQEALLIDAGHIERTDGNAYEPAAAAEEPEAEEPAEEPAEELSHAAQERVTENNPHGLTELQLQHEAEAAEAEETQEPAQPEEE